MTIPPSAGSAFTDVNTYALVSVIAALLCAPVGIVFGILALRQIKQTGERGRALALAGLWVGVGITATALLILGFSALIVVWAFSLVESVPR